MTRAMSYGLDNSLGRAGSAVPGRGGRGTRKAPAAILFKRDGRDAAKDMPTAYAGRPILRLNKGWSVGDDAALQWFLLRASGKAWVPRRYHVERDALLRSIRELCGPVDPAALETIRRWPPKYRPDFAAAPARATAE